MFQSLPQFYASQEWRNLRQIIIMSRTKEDGFVYDEFNGQPLLRPYDIVAHHKTPLTMQNVNDRNISLNPDNIMLVSQKSHNEIHARFGFMAERKAYYVWGAPCSGKTTYVNEIKGNSDLVVDIDNIWQCVTAGNRYEKPNALKTNVFAIRDLLYDQIRTRTGKWERAFVIEGGALKGDRARKVALLGAEDIYINTDKETCLKRLASDEKRTQEQKQEWIAYIERWFNDFQE
jgi:hypothetical protein